MGLLPDIIDENSSGKNLDSLAKSRKIRQQFVAEFGEVPTSILVNDRRDRALDFVKKQQGRDYKTISRKRKKGITTQSKDEIAAWETSGRSASKGALSAFPQNVGRTLVKFYCPKNGIVYDPFAGHNSRMQLTYEAGRNYIGVDISKEFMIYNRQIQTIIQQRGLLKSENTITLIEGSSSKVDLPDNYADFTVTSPPYYNIEYYGDEPEQLGNAKTYQKFLELITDHVRENYRILKPGAFCCWNVNDFIKNGVYLTYHADLIPIFISVGFVLHTIYIIDLGLPVQAAFVQNIKKTMRFPKKHEYILTFRKP